jgi:hypothetical protein
MSGMGGIIASQRGLECVNPLLGIYFLGRFNLGIDSRTISAQGAKPLICNNVALIAIFAIESFGSIRSPLVRYFEVPARAGWWKNSPLCEPPIVSIPKRKNICGVFIANSFDILGYKRLL